MKNRLVPAAALLASAALVGSLSACSFSASASTSKSIDGDKLASTIQKSLSTQNPDLTIEGMTCPDTPKITAGGTTNCSAKLNGDTTTFVVKWKNTAGDYEVSSVAA